jgi:hypothetical protein
MGKLDDNNCKHPQVFSPSNSFGMGCEGRDELEREKDRLNIDLQYIDGLDHRYTQG